MDNPTSINFNSLLSEANIEFWIAVTSGGTPFNEANYRLLESSEYRFTFGTSAQTNSNFETGTASGSILSVTMVPEPSSASLLTFALSGLLALRRRRKA